MSQRLSGSCLCGAVRYSADPTKTLHYLCHCGDCRRYGGSAGHYAIVVASTELTVEGEPRVWTKVADSGREVARHFCGDCGGHLFTSPWPEATRYSIKAGTLDNPSAYKPTSETWATSRVEWADLPADREIFDTGFPRRVDIGG